MCVGRDGLRLVWSPGSKNLEGPSRRPHFHNPEFSGIRAPLMCCHPDPERSEGEGSAVALCNSEMANFRVAYHASASPNSPPFTPPPPCHPERSEGSAVAFRIPRMAKLPTCRRSGRDLNSSTDSATLTRCHAERSEASAVAFRSPNRQTSQ